jgi:radical SAM superfamily enzyme YgiQ (UPF0313 family)
LVHNNNRDVEWLDLMTKNICLIIPPSPFLLDERVFMPLGILKVAAAVENAGIPVEVLDLSGYSNYEEIVRAHISVSGATVCGVTSTTPQFPAAVRIAAAVRAAKQIPIILGGPHATLVHAAEKREQRKGVAGRAARAFSTMLDSFDRIVAGDGETAFLEALDDGAPRVIDADGRQSPHFLDDRRLNETAWPARHLIEVGSYRYQIDGARALSLIAQLGCPFGCGFCAGRHSPMLRHTRMRTSDNIVAEMLHMRRIFDIRGFMFYDDELNVNPRMVELMEKIADGGDDWKLRGFIKAELFTDEQAAAMVRAGFRWILVGFESGSPRILDNIQKRATQEDNSRCMAIARRHGLKVKALMSLGHPGESMKTIAETRAWLIDERPDDFDATVITPYPGSPYYDDAEAGSDGIFTYRARNSDALHQFELDYAATADYYKGSPDDGYVSHVFTDHLSAGAIVRLRDDLEQRVRSELDIPFNAASAAVSYEHSMGQTALPSNILRSSVGMEMPSCAQR